MPGAVEKQTFLRNCQRAAQQMVAGNTQVYTATVEADAIAGYVSSLTTSDITALNPNSTLTPADFSGFLGLVNILHALLLAKDTTTGNAVIAQLTTACTPLWASGASAYGSIVKVRDGI